MIDYEKFVKYSKPGPRYTSYPTAPEFSENFKQEDLKDFYKKQDKNRALSLYIHLPFCRSACYFCGCNTIFTSKEDKKTRYIEYLKKLQPISNKVKAVIPTLNGSHLITSPFNTEEFMIDYPNFDIHKNNPTILYFKTK